MASSSPRNKSSSLSPPPAMSIPELMSDMLQKHNELVSCLIEDFQNDMRSVFNEVLETTTYLLGEMVNTRKELQFLNEQTYRLKSDLTDIHKQLRERVCTCTSSMQTDVGVVSEPNPASRVDDVPPKSIKSEDKLCTITTPLASSTRVEHTNSNNTRVDHSDSSKSSPPQANTSVNLGSNPCDVQSLGPNFKKVVMKPVVYDGKEDWEEYLSQFEIVADINKWNDEEKGLYLAGSLSGSARAVLSDLDSAKRRNFTELTTSLQRRFGSESKSDMYRAKLQTKVKGRDESISDLSRAIRKLTRQAYPKAQQNVLETLSVDYFIDAIVDPDIRLRLREAQLETLTQAETLAVRLESHKLADKYRNRPVRAVEGKRELGETSAENGKSPPNEQVIETLRKELNTLKRTVETKLACDGANQRGQSRSQDSNVRGLKSSMRPPQQQGDLAKQNGRSKTERNSENSEKPDSRAEGRQ